MATNTDVTPPTDMDAPDHLCGGGARCDICGKTYEQFTKEQAEWRI